jgi:hypothetical protein
MNVFIVTKSYDTEGTEIKKVFTDKKTALDYCKIKIEMEEGELEKLPTGYKKNDCCYIYEMFPVS